MRRPTDPEFYEVFAHAAGLTDPAEQEAYLIEKYGHDRDALKRLREALAARESADELFKPIDLDLAMLGNQTGQPKLGRVGHFRLQQVVGRGGMGTVFLAYDEKLRRQVALKFPRLHALEDPELANRFLREARLAASLNHQNLVDIYEVDVWENSCFIASRWCEHGDLAGHLEKSPGPHDPTWAATLLRDVARAVAYCHQQGVVHLDIKPANIMLDNDPHAADGAIPKPMLTDFGVARVIEEGLTDTQSSVLLGTPLYMAPEQAACDREQIGPPSDVFALGVVLYELLYGNRPFEGASAIEVVDKIRSQETIALPRRGIPRDLRTIIGRCLEHDCKLRYSSADALAEDLDRYLRGDPIHARPVSSGQRIWRWLQRPERMEQAGITAIVFQTLLLVNFACLLGANALGWELPPGADLGEMVYGSALVSLALHIPNIVVAYFTFRRVGWTVPIGTFFGAATLIAMLFGITAEDHPLTFYKQYPTAQVLLHLVWIGAMSIQTIAYVAAYPAAFRQHIRS